MKPEMIAIFTGGITGALFRPAVVMASFCLTVGISDMPSQLILVTVLMSMCIGFAIGAFAAWCATSVTKPSVGLLLGAGIGGALAHFVSYFTFCFFCVLSYSPLRRGEPKVIDEEWTGFVSVLITVLMIASGALPGLIGGGIGLRMQTRESQNRIDPTPR